ncbi:MAG: DUF2019 domain-containing protein [Acidobacteria bacterium]|nr:DUF2019 domain-containing protein [Acidobacteriota bacterium]
MKIVKLVTMFAENVIKQNAYIKEGNSSEGNKAAKKYVKAFKEITGRFGDEGREALVELLKNPDEGVRAMAAAFLLRYKTEEAKRVLSEIATGKGFAAFGASETLKRWQEGTWALDITEKGTS